MSPVLRTPNCREHFCSRTTVTLCQGILFRSQRYPPLSDYRCVPEKAAVNHHEGHCQAPKLPHVDVIRTTFDWKHVVNQTFSAKTDRKENSVWTEVERVKAEAGEVVEDMNDLRNKVCELKLCIATDLLTSCLP